MSCYKLLTTCSKLFNYLEQAGRTQFVDGLSVDRLATSCEIFTCVSEDLMYVLVLKKILIHRKASAMINDCLFVIIEREIYIQNDKRIFSISNHRQTTLPTNWDKWG